MFQVIIVIMVFVIGLLYLKNNLMAEKFQETDVELWVMTEANDYFLTQSEILIEDDAIALIEGMNLGESDGHSSGANQFDFNFINIQDFDKAKTALSEMFASKYPQLNYVISTTYEMSFEKVD